MRDTTVFNLLMYIWLWLDMEGKQPLNRFTIYRQRQLNYPSLHLIIQYLTFSSQINILSLTTLTITVSPPSLDNEPLQPHRPSPQSHAPKPQNLPHHPATVRNRKIMRPLNKPPLDLLLPKQVLHIWPQLLRNNNRIPFPHKKEYFVWAKGEAFPDCLLAGYGREAHGGHEAVCEAEVVLELPCDGLFDCEIGADFGKGRRFGGAGAC